MAIFRVFKTPRHQKFEYRPRYWDPDKEALEDRLKKFEEGKEKDPDAIKARIASGFRRQGRGGGNNTALRGRYMFRSNMLLLVVIVALLFISYFFISVYLPNFMEMFEKGGTI
ncbi:MAG: hypothetical protein AAGG75_13975 [Bacteroidota bacterium]